MNLGNKDLEQVLVMGASPEESRYSNIATKMLKSYGHQVVCFGKRTGTCSGEPIVQQFPKNDHFHTVTLYLNPAHQEQYYEEIIAMNPGRVIFNPGTENEEFEEKLTAANIPFEEACTLVLLRSGQF